MALLDILVEIVHSDVFKVALGATLGGLATQLQARAQHKRQLQFRRLDTDATSAREHRAKLSEAYREWLNCFRRIDDLVPAVYTLRPFVQPLLPGVTSVPVEWTKVNDPCVAAFNDLFTATLMLHALEPDERRRRLVHRAMTEIHPIDRDRDFEVELPPPNRTGLGG